MRLRALIGCLLIAVVPACAASDEEAELRALDANDANEWGEQDEDADPITDAEEAEALADDEDDGEPVLDYTETAPISQPAPEPEDEIETPPNPNDPANPAPEFPEDPDSPVDPDSEAGGGGDGELGYEDYEGGVDADGDGVPDGLLSAERKPTRPASCNAATSLDLDVYYERSSRELLPALKRHAKRCSRYWIGIPKVAANPKFVDAMLWPRTLKNNGPRAYGKHFFATAEVHWGGAKTNGKKYAGWKNVEVIKLGPGKYTTKAVPKARIYKNDWFLKGVLFRQRMAKKGFRPQLGDTWHLNELESAWTRTRVQQKAIRDLVRGLAAGDQEYDAFADEDASVASLPDEEKARINVAARMKNLKGIVYISALGKRRPGESSDEGWKNALKQTLRRWRFWADMAKYVDHWAQERYLPPAGYCKKGQSLDAQSDHMEKSIMELPLLAASAPHWRTGPKKGESMVGTALFYLTHHYSPTVNAAWGFRSDAQSLATMRSFVSGEVFATRRFSNANGYPDSRIGIYFRPKDDGDPKKFESENVRFADRVAWSLNGAYNGKSGAAIGACGPRGAEGCTCGD